MVHCVGRWGTKKVGKSKEEFDDLLKKENVNFMEVGGTQLHWLHTPIGHRIHVVAQCIQVLVGADANLGVPVSTDVVQDLI